MTAYTEKRGITTKREFSECDAIGWSVLDCATIYQCTTTEFSIARGLINQYRQVVNQDGSEYKPSVFRTYSNAIISTYYGTLASIFN